ncbi:unnamed protein product [Phaedon cochleariae]|uniref:Uncharacterized protein n=1 Tax=Phaedon cochleariae TaxID=80249 RepID=A0A9N9SL73_PHACE|nr:unnamed protein product [Phaedon cochleariae]
MIKTRSSSNSPEEIMIESIINKLVPKLTTKLEEHIVNLGKKIDIMEEKFNGAITQLSSLESIVKSNDTVIIGMNSKLDIFAQKLKANSLRLIGIKEEQDENLSAKVLAVFNDALKVRCSLLEINNLFRIGKPNKDDTKSRTIIVEFVSLLKKNEILMSRKNLINSGIYVNENLSNKNYQLLRDAKQKYGNRAAWSKIGKVFAKRDNTVIAIKENGDIA